MLMFKQIVSKLSLSPSAAAELSFYARRLGQERITRTFSVIAAVMVVGLQFATILAPPAPSNAASPSDIIYGGFTSKDDLLNRYDGSAELKALYNYFGISRTDVASAQTANINSSDHSLNSLGRVQHGADDQQISVGGATYWARYLYQFDTGANVQRGSTYQVLQGHRASDGSYFAVMFRCGNLVFQSLPKASPPPPTPKPTPTPSRTPAPTPVPTPKTTPSPTLACVSLRGDVAAGIAPLKVAYTGQGTASGQSLTDYIFNFGDNTTTTQAGPTVTHQYSQPGTYLATLQVKGSVAALTPVVAACSFSVTVSGLPPAFTKSKTALNLTQNIDATTRPARAGDQIKYNLMTKNTGGTASGYVVVEHIDDILEYANVTGPNGATQAGSTLTWPTAVIKPGETLVQTFVVQVKSPVPATPAGLSDPLSYDLQMDNVYGNQVSIKLEAPLPKQVEVAAASLPQTGTGASTFIVLLVAGLAVFFYARNRQLAAEVRLLRHDYQGGLQS
mgnify:CR=1 FL=1